MPKFRALLTLIVALALAAPTATAAQAKVNEPSLTVTSVTLGTTSVAASGVDLTIVPVTVAAKYVASFPGDIVLRVFLKRTAGVGPAKLMVSAPLPLVSGTIANGVWKGSLYVPSTANGTFKVYGVMEGEGNPAMGGGPVETPYDGQSLAVAGTHLPKFSVSIIPKIVPAGSPYKVRVTIYDSATSLSYGKPIKLQITWEAMCMEGGGGGTTSTAGIVELTFPALAAEFTNCALLKSPGVDILVSEWAVLRSGIVGAAPSKPSAPVGTIVPVNGTVGGAPAGCAVVLQRLIGSTQWRGVSQSKVSSSGRYKVLAQPPYVGNVIYRVAFPTCGRFQAAVSKSFVIRGV